MLTTSWMTVPLFVEGHSLHPLPSSCLSSCYYECCPFTPPDCPPWRMQTAFLSETGPGVPLLVKFVSMWESEGGCSGVGLCPTKHIWDCGPLCKCIPNWASCQLWKETLSDEGEMRERVPVSTNQPVIAMLPPSGRVFLWTQAPLALVSCFLKRDMARVHPPPKTVPIPISTLLPPSPPPSLPPSHIRSPDEERADLSAVPPDSVGTFCYADALRLL